MSTYSSTLQRRTFHDGETIRLAGTYRTFSVALTNGPFSDPDCALIPEAVIIDGRAKPAPDAELSYGDVLCIEGHGDHRIVKTRNPDWPRLVPVGGPRFYVEFEGQRSWAIRDRDADGEYVPWAEKARAAEHLGIEPRGRWAANLIAAWLTHEDNNPRGNDRAQD